MSERFVSRGFVGSRRSGEHGDRIPPGQYVTEDFPVLSAGPTPKTPLQEWSFAIDGLVESPATWSWDEFIELPAETYTVDIHCVTKWSKLDTLWEGVSVDSLLSHVELDDRAMFVTAVCDGGYTTNLALADLTDGQAFMAYRYDRKPLTPEHGGPARLVVPHLYFWKSAKWVRRLRITAQDQPGFWESAGYHNRGDPFKEQRYRDD